MAPLRRLTSIALGLVCCMTAVLAQDDTPAPVLISGAGGGSPNTPAPVLFSNNIDPNGPVFLPGVVLDNSDSGAAAPPAPATENVLLANGTTSAGNNTDPDGPVFLPGVYLDGSSAGSSGGRPTENVLLANSTTPAPAATTAAPANTTAAPAATTDGSGSDVVLGGWPSMRVGDTEIQFLVKALSDAKYYNPSLPFGICMKDIFGLEYQSVSGTNFRYSGHGCLVKKGSSDMGACTYDCDVQKLQVIIYTQEWTNTIQVSSVGLIA